MLSPGRSNPTTMPAEAASAPRISFSGDFINGQIVISKESSKPPVACSPDFEFLAGDSEISMLPADELFFEGRVLPFWRAQCAEKLSNINITLKQTAQREEEEKPKGGVNWFVDEDPSPRPPKCTVLWKELLKLKKQHSAATEGDKDGAWKRKKGLERTRSASVRIRPVLKMPICTQGRIKAKRINLLELEQSSSTTTASSTRPS
ncbi:uncharacterized protein [Aristolochia californica]|uniref:uncharacterized protein n=1 Tax=Aristolochia californica TaxID=171875 RepID=UPI0035E294FD